MRDEIGCQGGRRDHTGTRPINGLKDKDGDEGDVLLDTAHRGRKISVKTVFHFFWSSAENTAGRTFF